MLKKELSEIHLHFIIGLGRSGTTLLSSILNSHPNILSTPEVLFILFFFRKFKDKKYFSEKDISLLIEYLRLFSNHQPYIGWNFNETKLQNTLSEIKDNISFLDLCKIIYLHFEVEGKNSNEVSLIVDKNPVHTLNVEKLIALSPESKFILMVRDYRANILSRKQNIHVQSPNTALNALRWNMFNAEGLRLLKKYPDKIMPLRYEDLVSNPEQNIRSVCEFLRVPFFPSMLEFHRAEQKRYSREEIEKYENRKNIGIKKYGDLSKPVNASRVEAWRKELSPKDIAIAEHICGSIGKNSGYIKSHSLNFSQKIVLSAKAIPYFISVKTERWRDEILFYVSPEMKILRMRQKYSKTPVKSEDTHPVPLHFLIGVGRSGTTLLTMILNEHHNILSTPENNFLLFFYKDFHDKNFTAGKEQNLFAKQFSKKFNQAISIWKPPQSFIRDIFRKHPQGVSYATLCRHIYLDYNNRFGKQQISVIIDKNPVYSLHIKTIAGFFPDSKFIVLVRDYRDNVLSHRKNFTGTLDFVSIHAEVWKIYYETIFKFYRGNEHRILFVKYEDLVSSPAETVKKICGFIGMDFSEKMLEYYRNIAKTEKQANESLNKREAEIIFEMHKNLTQPVNTSRVNAWEKELSEREIKTVEMIAGQTGKNFGYMTTRSISSLEKMILYFLNFPFILFARCYTFIFSVYTYYIPLKWRAFIPKMRGK